MNGGKILEESDDAGMVESAPAANAQGGKRIARPAPPSESAHQWSGPHPAIRFRSSEWRSILKPGAKSPLEDLLRFLIEAFASGETAGKSANHLLRIDSGFRAEDQCFANSREIDCDDDLIRQLRKAAGAERTHVRDRFSESIEDRKGAFEILQAPRRP